ncbi:hypothetical protein HYC85_020367 [Camellia sinensis]|uniref:VASt domain-containing protein n=1 Tax=Camellia sinensis TaxID=4442 RepID=A0A7J7GR95_CAMSI|nr:hypothetical protein HYC85_020367 [Camellia sinensis]
MEQSFFDLIYFLHCPGLAETFLDVLLSSVPIWLTVMIGLVIGWSWRPSDQQKKENKFKVFLKELFVLLNFFDCSILTVIQEKEQSALHAQSSSVRSSKSQAKITEESVPKTVKFQPFIKEEALVSIHNIGPWHDADEYDGQVREIKLRALCNSPMCPPNTAMTEWQHAVLSPDKKQLVFETVQQAHDVPFGSYFKVSISWTSLWFIISCAETEDEDIHKEYVEETNGQAITIASAKLIANDTVPEAYHRHMMVVSESNDGSLAGKSFQECKDLAARLSETFVGAARNKHRSDILKIVKDVNVYVPKDRVTNLHQGYGFVEFRSEDDADYRPIARSSTQQPARAASAKYAHDITEVRLSAREPARARNHTAQYFYRQPKLLEPGILRSSGQATWNAFCILLRRHCPLDPAS